MSSTRERAEAWASLDPNPVTAAYVRQLLASNTTNANDAKQEERELALLFPCSGDGAEGEQLLERIEFGTAGLRAAMKPGPVHMNDLVVIQTAQGLVRYCEQYQQKQQSQQPEPQQQVVVIGYDHRANLELQLSSQRFALWTALVFKTAGWDCILLDGNVATPLVPFGVMQQQQQGLRPAIGIMVTASHNPKQDAGYKVYWYDGCQIRSPIDAGIAAAIQDNLQPWVNYAGILQERQEQYPADPNVGLAQAAQPFIDSYFRALEQAGLMGRFPPAPSSSSEQTAAADAAAHRKMPKFCYTAMHGVGYPFAKYALEHAVTSSTTSTSVQQHLPFAFCSVPSQQEPDPEFPTVSFPNPEEKHALDLAQVHAVDNGCDIILANDPDADRLAVAEYNQATHTWTVFTGDQIGSMLGLWLGKQFQHDHREKNDSRQIAMCASTVSSKLLQEIAKAEGYYFEETLTGFKWIGSRLAALSKSGQYHSVFGYEEAIGFACGDVIFDKDGISACAVMVQLAVSMYFHHGKTLVQYMQSIYDQYGEFVSKNGYYFLPTTSMSGVLMQQMCDILEIPTSEEEQDSTDSLAALAAPGRSVGPYAVEYVRYLGKPGYDSSTDDRKPTLPTSASSPMLSIRFANGCVAQFRASGTEPKFKYYIELKGAPGVNRDIVATELEHMSSLLLEALLQPSKHGLTSKK